FKFGIGGSDNEGGKGGFGNNHIENIDDSQTSYILASDWGSINPKFYNTWDFTNHTKTVVAVEDYWTIPMAYELSQNYPNPFNPTTTIQFTIPSQDVVTLKIFNVLGQEIMTLMHEKMDAGKHTVRFDASKLTSGVYLYQVTAGKFVDTKKMVLLK
ncbi:MAG TPA: T9SS type A sorting domain-containing protein, partial [Bacteroidota bacterium]|nr:T9SS type A sorting domain-containing protein [Bacteroidota bacterium]